ncbi:hypothetical protein Deipr_2302 (plasmid) [Deinococcus proteolyticus MRP]|uniref:Uncharacterized protein n=1 Tax=Deinococcus proteolyticus (strain ATCC 35074 / DSM 20540 / JCM 6276 / NBRC 101906 / NCIMB 13154 / VKM Ac-1939 / CCM 2703 / MRP) TaxID=693977 RepID=F0RQ68_DEIPM|nr:hypothetical protein [Deinococcus proteolyticus]ADY27427.1 hypothetical protein Deipr_2302 [Deinococcus proteolyticus MRP]
MNTNDIRSTLKTAAAELDKESREQYSRIRQEMVVAAGTLRSIAASLPAEGALGYLRQQRELLDSQDELFAWSRLGEILWDANMAELDRQMDALLAELRAS